MLPHADPILLVDNHSIIDGINIEAEYTVPHDHPVLEGHFPHVKVWPGVYLLEGMNQTAGIHAMHSAQQMHHSNLKELTPYVTRIDNAKFRKPVMPGAKLSYTATLVKNRANHVFYQCTVWCQGIKVAEATVGITAK